MKDSSNRRWLLIAAVILMAMVTIWVLAVLQLNPAAAGGSRISLSFRSRLAADYGPDEGQSLGSLSLSIVSDLMEDLGMGASEAEAHSDAMRVAMLTPVPTATALNFEGDPPPSATPTKTPVPTNLPTGTPEPTATNTQRPTTTNTAEPTDEPKPTSKPKTATPSCSDCKDPKIVDASVSPNSGSFSSCDFNVTLSDFHIVDPDFSSGISWVGIKYKYDSGSYYYYQMSKKSGGMKSPGSTWDAYYDGGTITLKKANSLSGIQVGGKSMAKFVAIGELAIIDTATPTPTDTPVPPTDTPTPTDTPIPPTDTPIPSTDTPTPITHNITIWAKVTDNVGRTVYKELGNFTCTE